MRHAKPKKRLKHAETVEMIENLGSNSLKTNEMAQKGVGV